MSLPDQTDDEDDLVGSVLDNRYRIERRLGEGGMGLVYAAEHQVLKVRVAIKVLRAESSEDDEAMERLRREAQSASQIGNEHIVDVRDFGQLADGSTYVVMELIEGVDLFRETRPGPLPWARAVDVAVQICEALGAAHQRGIVHRDLKAENVLLTERDGVSDFVKVVDFGIAKVSGSSKLTVAGRVMGTPEYMSPEQCEGVTVDHRTDIYSLGILLYEMLTGRLPFAHRELVHLIRMQMKEPPVAPSKVVPEAQLPLALEAVVLRCLAKRPDDRFQSMDEVAEALVAVAPAAARWRTKNARRALEPAPVAQRTLDDDDPIPAPVVTEEPGPAGRGLGWIGVVLAVAGLAAGAGAVFIMQGRDVAAVSADPNVDATPETVEPEPATEPPPTTPGVETAAEPPAAPSVREILIESEPSGAEVYHEDALVGSTPLSLRRPPDGERWELSLRARGYVDHPVVIGAISGARIHVVLEPLRGQRSPANENGRSESGGDNETRPRTPRDPSRPNGNGRFIDPWDQR